MPRTSEHEGAQQQATGQRGAAPIDHAILGNLLGGDQEAVSVVLRQFRSSCPGDASALGAALSRNDRHEASRWAHRLKGACQLVGAPLLTRACERAEAAIRTADASLAATAVAEIDCEAQRITGYLDAWLKTAARPSA